MASNFGCVSVSCPKCAQFTTDKVSAKTNSIKGHSITQVSLLDK